MTIPYAFRDEEELRKLLSSQNTVIFGGPRSGKTTLLQCLCDRAVGDFRQKHQFISLLAIRPYWSEPDEVRNRISVAIIEGLQNYADTINSTTDRIADLQLPNHLSIDGIKELALQENVDPLRWSLQTFNRVSSQYNYSPFLFLDDADFLLISGVLSEVIHLCEVYGIGTILNGRSFCSSTFDSTNILAEYVRAAELICLDFLPSDDRFKVVCSNALDNYTEAVDGDLKKTAQRAQIDTDLFNKLVTLSGGQIGRFYEVIKFVASIQKDGKSWRWPTRKELGDYCESVVTQMLQRESEALLADTIRKWMRNMRPVTGSRFETSVGSTWISLPIGEMDNNLLSTVRAGVLSWIFQCSPENRINTGKQPRFVPDRIRLSSMAAIAADFPAKIAIG